MENDVTNSAVWPLPAWAAPTSADRLSAEDVYPADYWEQMEKYLRHTPASIERREPAIVTLAEMSDADFVLYAVGRGFLVQKLSSDT